MTLKVQTIDFQGRTVRAFAGDWLASHLIQGKYYDGHNLKTTSKFINNNTVVLDIGANIGNHSLFYLTRCKCKYVHAFEPVPEVYKLLKLNLAGFNNVSTTRCGISDQSRIYDHNGINPKHVGSTVFAESNTGTMFQTIDGLGFDDVGFMKIDVEGFELNVLRGAEETIRTFKPHIAVEVREHDAKSAGMGQDLPETASSVRDFLRLLGYSIETSRHGATQFICSPK